MTAPHELIRRVADVLRAEVGPATSGGAGAQAYGASAVLRRVARGLELSREHAEADESDRRRLHEDVADLLAGTSDAAPATLAAVAALGDSDYGGDYKAALDRLVASLHQDRPRLPEATFERTVARVRLALRAVLDRELEVAR